MSRSLGRPQAMRYRMPRGVDSGSAVRHHNGAVEIDWNLIAALGAVWLSLATTTVAFFLAATHPRAALLTRQIGRMILILYCRVLNIPAPIENSSQDENRR